jgi:hypothetical protein
MTSSQYITSAMYIIRKSKAFTQVSGKQIDALATFLESKQGSQEKFSMKACVSVVKKAR